MPALPGTGAGTGGCEYALNRPVDTTASCSSSTMCFIRSLARYASTAPADADALTASGGSDRAECAGRDRVRIHQISGCVLPRMSPQRHFGTLFRTRITDRPL